MPPFSWGLAGQIIVSAILLMLALIGIVALLPYRPRRGRQITPPERPLFSGDAEDEIILDDVEHLRPLHEHRAEKAAQ